jgi:hypothetical protein
VRNTTPDDDNVVCRHRHRCLASVSRFVPLFLGHWGRVVTERGPSKGLVSDSLLEGGRRHTLGPKRRQCVVWATCFVRYRTLTASREFPDSFLGHWGCIVTERGPSKGFVSDSLLEGGRRHTLGPKRR